jgi:hypothetical protein
MAEKLTPYCIYKNQWYKTVFNESILLLERDGDFFLELPSDLYNWKIRIKFSTNNNLSQAMPIQMEYPNGEIHIKLTNWFGDVGVQTSEPLQVKSKDEKLKLLIVIKTIANRTHNYRTLMLTIWKMA